MIFWLALCVAVVVAEESTKESANVNDQIGKFCAKRLKSIEAVSGGFKSSGFRPACTPNGNYKLKQCERTIGCWCVDPETGAKVRNSQVRFNRLPICRGCHYRKFVMMENNNYPLPACTPEGDFQGVQCADGLCWCVDPTSGEMFGDKVDASIEFECTTVKVPKIVGIQEDNNLSVVATPINFQLNSPINQTKQKSCEAQRANDNPKQFVVGAFRHQCTVNGHYKVVQCHGSTGYCWCVDPATGEKASAEVPPGVKIQCKSCHTQKGFMLEADQSPLPNCKPDGDFHPIQCGSDDQCWCVNEQTGELYGEKLNSSAPFECATVQVQQIFRQGPPSAVFPGDLDTYEVHYCPIGDPLLDPKSGQPRSCGHHRYNRCPDTHFCNDNPSNSSFCCLIPPLPAPLKELLTSNCSRSVAQNFSTCLSSTFNSSGIFATVAVIQVSVVSGNFTNFTSLIGPLNTTAVKSSLTDNETFEFIRSTLNESCQLFDTFRSCAAGLDLKLCPILDFSQNLTEIIVGQLCEPNSLEEMLAAAKCFGLASQTSAGDDCHKDVEASLKGNFSDPFGPQMCAQVEDMFSCLVVPARNICGVVEADRHLSFMSNFLGKVMGLLMGPDCAKQITQRVPTWTVCEKEKSKAKKDGYVPQCSNSTGLYEKMQCSTDKKDKKTCWCVNPTTGDKLPSNKKFPLTC